MAKTVFIDMETTGLESSDRICELAVIIEEDEVLRVSADLCKSSKKISVQAMALHNITNEMLSGEKECKQSEAFRWLEKHNFSENVLVSHHIDFDLEMLAKEGFVSQMKYVDTSRCVKALLPESEQFSLQFLRYELHLYKQEEELARELGVKIRPHRALSDTLHILLLFRNLLQYATLSELIEISSNPILMQKFPFGKYSGRYIEEIVEIDPAYVQWMLGSIKDMDADLLYSLEYYLKESR